MFDSWSDPPGVKILQRVDRPVLIYTNQVWISVGNPVGLAPPDARKHGLKIASLQPGQQVAWVRLTTGEWLGVIHTDVASADGHSRLSMQLWLQKHQFRPA